MTVAAAGVPTQFAVMVAFILIGSVVLAVCVSGSSIGRALLPRSVTDVLSKLLPRSLITDAAGKDLGEFQVDVTVAGEPQTVQVRRSSEMTVAWTHDASVSSPRSGTFAFTGLRHNLKADSAISPEKLQARIGGALADVLRPKGFEVRRADEAGIWISVFGALEDEVTLHTITEVFDEPDGYEWAAALRTALQHDEVGEVATFARGSLVLDVVDSQTQRVLWRAAAMADIVVDVSLEERERRTREAITAMLSPFPPPRGSTVT